MLVCIRNEGQNYNKFAYNLAEDTKAIPTHLHMMLVNL